MPEICEKCGVKGCKELLIYCSQCNVSAEHRYCLDKLPELDVPVLEVIWSCEQCAPRASSSFNRLGLHPSRRSERLKKKKRKRKRKKIFNFSKAEIHLQNRDPTIALQPHEVCLKGDAQMNEDVPDLAEVAIDPLRFKENYIQHSSDGNSEEHKVSKKRRRKLILDDEGRSDEDTESAKGRNSPVAPDVRCLKGDTQMNEDVPDLAEVAIDPLRFKENYIQHSSDGNSEENKVSKKRRRKLILDDEGRSDEDTESAKGRNSPVVPDVRCLKGDTQMNEDVPDLAKVAIDRLPFKENYIQHSSDGNSEEHKVSKKRRRKLILDDEGRSDEDTESAKGRNSPVTPDVRCLKGDTQMNEDVPDLAEVAADPLPFKENYIQHSSDGNSEEHKVSKKRRRKLILDDEGRSDEDTESAKGRNSPVAPDVRCLKGDTQMNEDVPELAEVAADPLPFKENDIQHSSDGNSEEHKVSKKRRRKLILDDEGRSDEDTESAKDRNSLVAPDVRNTYFGLSSHEPSPECGYYGPALPIRDPVWRGCFSICNEKSGKVTGIIAHLSNKACLKVFEVANALPGLLGMELLPRPDAWPESFRRSLPTDDNIGLYFFPESKCDEELFDGLLHDIIDRDLALKSVTDNAELLIFSSLQLPPLFHRFQGKYFLWGVFRGKQVSLPPQPADHLLIRDSSIKCAMSSILADNFASRDKEGLH